MTPESDIRALSFSKVWSPKQPQYTLQANTSLEAYHFTIWHQLHGLREVPDWQQDAAIFLRSHG